MCYHEEVAKQTQGYLQLRKVVGESYDSPVMIEEGDINGLQYWIEFDPSRDCLCGTLFAPTKPEWLITATKCNKFVQSVIDKQIVFEISTANYNEKDPSRFDINGLREILNGIVEISEKTKIHVSVSIGEITCITHSSGAALFAPVHSPLVNNVDFQHLKKLGEEVVVFEFNRMEDLAMEMMAIAGNYHTVSCIE